MRTVAPHFANCRSPCPLCLPAGPSCGSTTRSLCGSRRRPRPLLPSTRRALSSSSSRTQVAVKRKTKPPARAASAAARLPPSLRPSPDAALAPSAQRAALAQPWHWRAAAGSRRATGARLQAAPRLTPAAAGAGRQSCSGRQPAGERATWCCAPARRGGRSAHTCGWGLSGEQGLWEWAAAAHVSIPPWHVSAASALRAANTLHAHAPSLHAAAMPCCCPPLCSAGQEGAGAGGVHHPPVHGGLRPPHPGAG